MALFGKKKTADAPAPATAASPTAGGVAVATPAPVAAPVAAKARKVKPAKSTTSKGGTVVGLNIGNAFIKAVEVTSKGGQLSVTGIGVIATPPESYSNGNVLSVTALSNALRMMWRQAGLNSKATIFSVAGTGSLVVRVIEVPKMTDGELADNMRVDADRYIPFPPSEVVMDVKALRDLPSDPDAANMEVLLAAAQREIIDLHVAVVQKAKLTPRAIDVEPLALARTMQLELRAQSPIIDYDDVTAVLNIGQTGTEITIMRGDIVVFTRSVPNGGGNLTQAIAESMGIPPSDAERLKIERGDALPPAGYNQDGGQEDYGFGDFGDDAGGGATMDFSSGGFDDDFGGNTATAAPASSTATATDTGTSAGSGAGSDDPFDLDFFDQGPQQSEPGAGHGQKEDDEDDKAAGISFSFDKLDDDLAPSVSPTGGVAEVTEVTPASPPPARVQSPSPTALSAGDGFALEDSFLPATDAVAGANTGAAESAPSAPAMPSAFDFSDFDLPTVENSAQLNAPAANISAPTQKFSDDIIAPIATPVAAPIAAPATSSFGFSKGDDEATTPATTKPVASTLEASPSALSFEKTVDDGASDAVIVAPIADLASESAISLDKTDDDVAAVVDPLAQDDGFGLDDVFGAPDASAAPVIESADEGGFDMGGFGHDARDFDVSALDATTDGSDDFSSFGTGLSQTGETDDSTLYAAMQPVLEDLATEVRRSLEFHLGRYPDTTFSRLVLVGGGAKLRNLDEFLAGNLGVPTSVGDPFAHIKVNVPGLPAEFAPTNAPLCAVALGLALRDFIE